jgi:hypothetical protein
MMDEKLSHSGLETLPPRVSQRDLAHHWNMSVRTLQRWRAAGDGPAWVQIGATIYYRIDDIRMFEDSCHHLGGGTS